VKKLIISLILGLVLVLGVSGAAMADDPDPTDDTVVNINWTGPVNLSASIIQGDDATISYAVVGSNSLGSLTMTDTNYCPYAGYHVDDGSSYFVTSVTDGFALYQVDRNDSYSPMYGPAGQCIYSYIAASGGTAEMAGGVTTNYAQQRWCTYDQPKTSSGKNFEANAASFLIQHFVGKVAGYWDNFSEFIATGSGVALIDSMSSETSGCWDLQRGDGCGCYTNSDMSFNGAGTLTWNSVGSNSITMPSDGGVPVPGDGTFGSCSWNTIINYVGSWSIPNTDMRVN